MINDIHFTFEYSSIVSMTPLIPRAYIIISLIAPHFLYCDFVMTPFDSNCINKLNGIFNSCQAT